MRKKLTLLIMILVLVINNFTIVQANERTTTGPAISITTKQAIEFTNRGKLFMHAFYSGRTAFNTATENYVKSLDSVSFAWLDMENHNGEVVLNENNSKTDFHRPTDYYKPLELCRANNIPAQLAIFSDGNTAKAMMGDESLKSAMINRIIDSLTLQLPGGDSFSYSGVVIDFEGLRQEDSATYFNDFLKELKDKLVLVNKKLYVAVNVRTYWPGYNYSEILKYADRVILMAHDYEPNGALTKAEVQKYINYKANDPIYTMAPIDRVKADLEDMISCITDKSDMDKILLQLSFGIAQWQFPLGKVTNWTNLSNTVKGTKSSPTYEMLMNRISNKDKQGTHITQGYIKQQESPYLTYYNSANKTFNFLLYENDRSIKAKMDLATLEGIGGISIWRIGSK